MSAPYICSGCLQQWPSWESWYNHNCPKNPHRSMSDTRESISLSAREQRLIEAIEQADQIIVLTHPELSSAEMNTLTTHQYIVWKNEKKRLGLADDEGRLTLTTDSESTKAPKPRGFMEQDLAEHYEDRIAELEKELAIERQRSEVRGQSLLEATAEVERLKQEDDPSGAADWAREEAKRLAFEETKKLAKATAALEKIADATSAFTPKRNVSYAAWELRLIARDTLAELNHK